MSEQKMTLTDDIIKLMADFRKQVIAVTEATTVSNNTYRTVIKHILNNFDEYVENSDALKTSLESVIDLGRYEVARNLEADIKALHLSQLTPQMSAIIQQVHDQAGKNADITKDIEIKITLAEYTSLVNEEEFRDLGHDMGLNLPDINDAE